MFRPLLALAMARLRGRHVVLVQHEWAGLHWLRRITYIPALLLADTIVMFSPLVRRELADDAVVGWAARKSCWRRCRRTSKRPPRPPTATLRQRLAAARQNGRIVIGHFGSIYPAKQPNALLNMCAILRATRAEAASGLCRLVHPRNRQCRGGISHPRRRARHHRRRHRQRLRRVRPGSVRHFQRDRRLLLSTRRRHHRAARQHPRLRAVGSSGGRHRSGLPTSSITIRNSRR